MLRSLFVAAVCSNVVLGFVVTPPTLRPVSVGALQATTDARVDETCDVLVLGSGPAGRAMASLLSPDLNVILADANFDQEWVPNYGVWQDEWETVVETYQNMTTILQGGARGTALDHIWEITDCFFGGSFDLAVDHRMRLDRPYCRVDKNALRDSLTTNPYKVLKANHISQVTGINLYAPAQSLIHDETGTTIQLKTNEDEEPIVVRTKLIVDATGHESKLILKDPRDNTNPPGFQIAYGALVEVEGLEQEDMCGPYDRKAMTLFDYRTDHLEDDLQRHASAVPTFMYTMPLEGNQIFFEETSLVARPAVSFQDCKDRCYKRLEYHGIRATKLLEEEYCYIPMGGALPQRDQRILTIGGAAGMVHPSTGYHLCRCLMGAANVAKVIQEELQKSDVNLDRAAAAGYHAIWTPENIRQRNFAVFGGEFLMKQNVKGLRGFFDGFFRLPLEQWAGFLAGWPGLPNNDKHESWLARMLFGCNFIIRLPPPVALDMAWSIVSYIVTKGVPLAQSVTPFLGEPQSYEYKRNTDFIGDQEAKQEARSMIAESKVVQEVPKAFERELVETN